MSFVPKWLQVTLVISIVAATVTDVDDECQASECSLELLHLRAKKISQAAEGRWEIWGSVMVHGIAEG
eukprot:Skav218610  [mRNA]  locus=scaffold3208:59731:59934:+ [translate_table: standard]